MTLSQSLRLFLRAFLRSVMHMGPDPFSKQEEHKHYTRWCAVKIMETLTY